MTDEERLAAATVAANGLLWALTGRRFGVVSRVDTVDLPGCCGPVLGASAGFSYVPVDFAWCTGKTRIGLRSLPVRAVASVTVDGVVAASGWSLVDGWLTGPCSHAPRVVEVAYTSGIPMPDFGAVALEELVGEFVLALTPNATCRLSPRAVSIARQGVQIELDDASALMAAGLTGLPITDAFIRSVNPAGLRRPSRIVSPDAARAR